MTIKIAASLSKISTNTLVSFTLTHAADEWAPYFEEYVVMSAGALAGQIKFGRLDHSRVFRAEILSNGRSVDVTD